MISGSSGAWASAVRMSSTACSGRSAAIAARARSFSAATWVGSAASTASTRASRPAASPVESSMPASATSVSRRPSDGAAASTSARERGDRRVGAALGEVEAGQHPPERGGVGGGGGEPLELGPGGRGAAGLEQEADDGERRLRVVGIGGRQRAQLGLGGGRVAGAEVPPRERPAHVGVVGEPLGHLGERGADRRVVAGLLDRGEPGEQQALVGGGAGEPGLGLGAGAGGVAGLQPPGDRDEARRHVARVLGERLRGHGERGLMLAGGEVEGRLEPAHPRIGGKARVGELDMGAGVGAVPEGERQLDELAECGDVVGRLLGQAQVLGERRLRLAAVAQQPGIGEPGGSVLRVQLEDVAELDLGPRRVAGGDERLGALEMRRGALLGAVAGGERQAGGEEQRKGTERAHAA